MNETEIKLKRCPKGEQTKIITILYLDCQYKINY
jgi:hypothetical protein